MMAWAPRINWSLRCFLICIITTVQCYVMFRTTSSVKCPNASAADVLTDPPLTRTRKPSSPGLGLKSMYRLPQPFELRTGSLRLHPVLSSSTPRTLKASDPLGDPSQQLLQSSNRFWGLGQSESEHLQIGRFSIFHYCTRAKYVLWYLAMLR
jgi:hypothetical protein